MVGRVCPAEWGLGGRPRGGELRGVVKARQLALPDAQGSIDRLDLVQPLVYVALLGIRRRGERGPVIGRDGAESRTERRLGRAYRATPAAERHLGGGSPQDDHGIVGM